MRSELFRRTRPLGDRCDRPRHIRRQRRPAAGRGRRRRHQPDRIHLRGRTRRRRRGGISGHGRRQPAHRHVEAARRPSAHGRARRLPDRADIRRHDGPVRRAGADARPPHGGGVRAAGLFLRVRGDAARAAQPRRHPRRRIRRPAQEARRPVLGAGRGSRDLQCPAGRDGGRRARVPDRLQRQPQHARAEAGKRSGAQHPRSGTPEARRAGPGRHRCGRPAAARAGTAQGGEGDRLDHRAIPAGPGVDQPALLPHHAAAPGVRDHARGGGEARPGRDRIRAGRAHPARAAGRSGPLLPAQAGTVDRPAGARAGGARHPVAGTRAAVPLRPRQAGYRVRCPRGGTPGIDDGRALRGRGLEQLAGPGRRLGRGAGRQPGRGAGRDGREPHGRQGRLRIRMGIFFGARRTRAGPEGGAARRSRRGHEVLRRRARRHAPAEGHRG